MPKDENKKPDSIKDPTQNDDDLSGLRDLVQDEIDKMMENQEGEKKDWNELVKEEKKIKEKKSKKIDEEDLCLLCKENEKSEGHDYCDECLEKLKKDPISIWKYIFPIIAIALIVLGSYKMSVTWSLFSTAAKADKYVRNNQYISALGAYEDYNTELKVNYKDPGLRTLNKQIEIYLELGVSYYETLNDFIDTNFAGKDLDSFIYKTAAEAKEKIEKYSDAYEVCYAAFNTATTYTEYVDAVDAANKETPIDSGYLAYYKYYAALAFGETIDVQLQNLDKMKACGEEYSSIYLPTYAEIYIEKKDYDAVLKTCNEMLSNNQEDIYAFVYQSYAYRLKNNLPKALNACNKGLKVEAENSLINYQMAIVQLLDGQEDAAFNYVKTAYQNAETEYSYLQASSLYAICAYMNGDTDTYAAIESDLTTNSYSFANEVSSYINNKTTIEDIFLTNGGDFTWT